MSKLVVVFSNGEINNDKAGQTYDCSFAGSTISCKLYTSSSNNNSNNNNNNSNNNNTNTVADISSSNTIISFCSKSSYSEAESAIKSYFSSFSNLTISSVSSDKGAGTIISISVNGNKDYSAGSYSTTTPIVVEIANGSD